MHIVLLYCNIQIFSSILSSQNNVCSYFPPSLSQTLNVIFC